MSEDLYHRCWISLKMNISFITILCCQGSYRCTWLQFALNSTLIKYPPEPLLSNHIVFQQKYIWFMEIDCNCMHFFSHCSLLYSHWLKCVLNQHFSIMLFSGTTALSQKAQLSQFSMQTSLFSYFPKYSIRKPMENAYHAEQKRNFQLEDCQALVTFLPWSLKLGSSVPSMLTWSRSNWNK